MAAADLRRREDEWEDEPEQRGKLLLLEGPAFLKAAVALKEKVVAATWSSGHGRERRLDPTVYTGLMGTAFTCLRSSEATGSLRDLLLCSEIADVCAAVARSSKTHLTFLCGCTGVFALGAVAADRLRDLQRRDGFLDLFFQAAREETLAVGPEDGGFGMPYDLLHGRSGFLWAALFLRKHLGGGSVPDELVMPVVDAVIAGGRAGAANSPDCPLVYRRHGTCFWGAAHGLAGIINVLLHFPLSGDDLDAVKESLRYMVRNRFARTGNYPTSEGNSRDRLVQWAHGAGGMALVLCKASEVFHDDPEFRDAAVEAGEVVWRRGLVREVALADGTAGNAYSFLALYRLTGERVFFERANAFADFVYRSAEKLVGRDEWPGGEQAFSLFHGLAGAACLWFDMISPGVSRFPGFEI